MSHKKWLLFGLFLIIYAFSPKICLANDGAYFDRPNSGSPFATEEHKEISLEFEKVLYKDNNFITIFKFKNNSNNEVKVKTGFPINGGFRKVSTTGVSNPEKHRNYFKFKTTINGRNVKRKLDIRKINGRQYQYIFHTELNFKPFEVITVKNEYFQEPISASFTELYDYREINYIAETGKTWQGKIKVAEFIFYVPIISNKRADKVFYDEGKEIRIKKNSFISYSPKAHQQEIKNNFTVIRYKFKNIDPDFNFRINWGNFHIEDYTIEDMDFCANIDKYLNENSRNNKRLSMFIHENKQDKYDSAWHLMHLKYFSRYTKYKYVYGDISDKFLMYSVLAFKDYNITDANYHWFFRQFDWYKPTKEIKNLALALKEIGVREYFTEI